MARLSDLVREQPQPPEPPGSPQPSGTDTRSSAPTAYTPATQEPNSPSQDSTDWYRLAQDELTRLMHGVQQGSLRSLGDLPRIAVGIVDSLSRGNRLFMRILSGDADSPLIGNLVNVAILAIKIAIGLEYERRELERLALAGLVHDVGMFSVPEAFVAKAGPLSASERDVIDKHPEVGAELLSGLGSGYGWLAQVALQEHERWLGQGYPKKLKGPQIHPYAQIIGIADVFDALVSPRPYHQRILPHEAVRELLVAEKSAFSREVVKSLVEQLSMYPLGTYVRLNSGEVGVVTELKPRYPLRPIIRVNPDAERGRGETKDLDLSTTTLLHIVEVIKPVEA